MMKAVQLALPRAPVEPVRPVVQQFLQIREVGALIRKVAAVVIVLISTKARLEGLPGKHLEVLDERAERQRREIDQAALDQDDAEQEPDPQRPGSGEGAG